MCKRSESECAPPREAGANSGKGDIIGKGGYGCFYGRGYDWQNNFPNSENKQNIKPIVY